jgi:hypothetical protein
MDARCGSKILPLTFAFVAAPVGGSLDPAAEHSIAGFQKRRQKLNLESQSSNFHFGISYCPKQSQENPTRLAESNPILYPGLDRTVRKKTISFCCCSSQRLPFGLSCSGNFLWVVPGGERGVA